ncbi:MAG: hypothetical protein DMG97_23865 [Acidobacteria bacterium]|nr:MAG: hypothetical protein DMG96_35690 [Acidobacteriota bacterium]PYV68760.1 MAG: hypothetical protein DMG97_23865 [Acidobacteriota bacterium]
MDPPYYFLKILANAGCYGIYAEVNKLQTGKNEHRTLEQNMGVAKSADGEIEGRIVSALSISF